MGVTIDMLLKICASIAVIGAAIVYIYKTIMFLKQPADKVIKKIEKHDEFLANDKARLDNLEHMMIDMRRCMVLLLESEIAVLEHLEDGNHTKALQEKKNNIANYLYGHVGVNNENIK
jgi:hypothetical protein